MAYRIKPEKGILEGMAYCDEHGCPLITVAVDGQDSYMCLFEAVDGLIGGETVTRVQVSREGYLTELAFGNGYRIRPLCVCCGEATLLGWGNGQALRGMTLRGLAWGDGGYGEDKPALILEFARDTESADVQALPVHVDSVRSLCKRSN